MKVFKSNNIIKCLFVLSCFCLLFSCGFIGDTDPFFEIKGEYIWFRNSVIKLRIDRKMFIKVYIDREKMGHSLIMAEPEELQSKPSHYVIVNGREVKNFNLVKEKSQIINVANSYGIGKRLIVKGVSDDSEKAHIEKSIIIDLYDKFPDTAVLHAVYKNIEKNRTLVIDKAVSNSFRLDASLVNKVAEPYEFWSFQGIPDYGDDWVTKITGDYTRTNYAGIKPVIGDPSVTAAGQGIPMVDLWTEKMGFAVALIEPEPKIVNFPVRSDFNNTVRIEVIEEPEKQLKPQQSYKTHRYALIVHRLDFYEPLKRLRELFASQGNKLTAVPNVAYLPYWSTTGYGENFTVSNIYNRFSELKKLNIGWVIIDKGWCSKFGEWFPSKKNFTDGNKSLKEIIYLLHDNGFRVMLWWLPLSVHRNSDMTEKYPGWFIRNRNGERVRSGSDSYYICPSLAGVKTYTEFLVKRFISDWNIDGLYIDGVFLNTVPQCYADGHNHQSPFDSQESLSDIFKIINRTAVGLDPGFVVKVNTGGVCPALHNMFHYQVPVVGEPASKFELRCRIKALKGFFGSSAPVDGNYYENNRWDFASYYAPGGILSGKFTSVMPDKNKRGQSPQTVKAAEYKWKSYERWYTIFHKYKLYNGEYLNLYDVGFEKPETHVIKSGDKYYYSFFAQSWKGEIELRGLEKRKYRLKDYVHSIDLGTVKGPRDEIEIGFKKYLLLEAIPE